MSSVLEGAVGVAMGGRVERSMDMVEEAREAREEGREAGGELSGDIVCVCLGEGF